MLLDTWAVLAWLNREEPAATVVRGLLDEADRDRQQLVMSMMNVGEVYCRLVGKHGWDGARMAKRRLLNAPILLESVDDELIWAAAELKGRHGIGYADSFAAALALRLDARLASGDPDFKPLEAGAGLRMRWLSRDGKK
jgi:predicted nucleic acid-binding protein